VLPTAANTLFFFAQNQFDTFSNDIRSGFSVFLTILLKPFIGFGIYSGFDFNFFWVL